MKSKRKTAERKPLGRRIRRFMRRHFFNKRAVQGSVTIFLIIIMLPMLIFSCSIIDICKIYMARNTTDGALELAMNSRLASYDDILKDMYGILASSANEEELSEKLATYYAMTLESSTGSKISKDEKKHLENLFADLFKSNPPALDGNGLLNVYEDSEAKFLVTPIPTSSVSNPEVMHRQIVEYMKYRGPVYLATGGFDMITAFTDVSNQTKAAQSQLNYEKKLSEAGDVFKKAYETLQELLNNADTLEGNSSTAFAKCYENGKIMPPKDYIKELKESVDAAYICSFFGGAFNDSGKLSYVSEAEEAFDSCKESGGSDKAMGELKDAMREIDGIKGRAEHIVDTFDLSGTAEKFINSNPSSVNYLIYDFGFLFKNAKSVKGSSEDDVIKFLEAYNNARKYSNELHGDLNNRFLSETRRKEIEGEIIDLDAVISEADKVVDAIEDAAEAIKNFMEEQYRDAKTKYDSAARKLYDIYTIINKQCNSLEWLLSSDGIDMIVSKMQEVAQKASEFGTSIEGIKTTSEKASMRETYNSGAAEMVEIAGEVLGETKAINDLKGILGVLKEAYEAEKKSLESITYFGNNIVTLYGLNVNFPLSQCLDKFRSSKSADVKSWYDFHTYKQSDYLSYETKAENKLGKWNSKNGAIRDNDFYKVVVKYGKTNETTNEDSKKNAEETKKLIDSTGNEAGGKLGNGDKQNDEEVKKKLEEESNVAKFIPENYPVYNSYLKELQGAWIWENVLKWDLDILNDDPSVNAMLDVIDSGKWFSTEPNSDVKENNTPGNYDTSGEIAENAGNMLGSIGDFFSNLLSATRDNLYISQYLTENFPCFTTLQENPDATMISGKKFKEDGKANVVCSLSSLEYILYGDMNSNSADESGACVAKASAVLFGVRFALNLIYALTSPTLALEIEPIIAPLEAIPFAGPIARTVILIGLALGESAIDISLLLANQEVALFKNDITWICSPKGFLKKAGEAALDTIIDKGIDEAQKAAKKALTDAEDKLLKSLENGVDQASAEIDNFVKEKLNDMKESIENDVWSPIVTTIKSYIENFKNTQITPPVSDIEVRLGEIFDSDSDTRNNLGLTDATAQDDELKKVEIEIFNYLRDNKGALAQLIHDNIADFSQTAQDALANTAEEAIDELDNKIKGVLNTVEEKIIEKFDGARESITEKLKSGIQDFAKDVQDKTVEGIDKVSDSAKKRLKAKFSAKTNASVRGTKSGLSGVDLSKDTGDGLISNKSKDPKTKDTSLKVTYKDYMFVFTVLGLVINEDEMLMRASQLMNANIELAIGGDNASTRTEKPKNALNSDVPYNINKAYTLFKGEAGSITRTMFLGTTWNKENQTWIRPAFNFSKYKATTYVGY